MGKFSHIWVQAKDEFIFTKTFYIFGYMFEPCKEIWKVVLNFG